MNKILILSHGELAKGIESSLDIFSVNKEKIEFFSAYTDDTDPMIQIDASVQEHIQEGNVIILTDLFGGSLTRFCLEKYHDNERVHIISGYNLALVMSLAMEKEAISQEKIEESIKQAQDDMKYVRLGGK